MDYFCTFETFEGIWMGKIEISFISWKVLSMAQSLDKTPLSTIAKANGTRTATIIKVSEESPKVSIRFF